MCNAFVKLAGQKEPYIRRGTEALHMFAILDEGRMLVL